MALVALTSCVASQDEVDEKERSMADHRLIEIELHPTGGWNEGARFKVTPRFRLPRNVAAPWVLQAYDEQTAVRAIDVILAGDEVPPPLRDHLPSGMSDMRMRLSLSADGWVERIRSSFDTYRADVVPAFDSGLGLSVARREGQVGQRYGKTIYYSDPAQADEFIYVTCSRGAEPSSDVCEFTFLATDNAVAAVYLDESALAHWKEVLSSIRSIVAHWIIK